MLIQRWNLFVNPENIQTDYHVEEMNRKEFYALFNDCQRKALEDEYAKAVDETDTDADEAPQPDSEAQESSESSSAK